MSKWDNISLFAFQRIDIINARTDISDIDKVLFSVCEFFGLTEYELDNMEAKNAQRLIKKVEEIFSSPFEPTPQKKIGQYLINYDMGSITFGQYVELAFFLSSKTPLHNAHYILSSVVSNRKKTEHHDRAEYFLRQPITKVMASVSLVAEKYMLFNQEYKGLFGLSKEVADAEIQENPFNKRYGWIYSASLVAEHERISQDAAFELPVRQALNDLAYLKAKGDYEQQLRKRTK